MLKAAAGLGKFARSKKGMAVIMVVLVITGLLVVAAPFFVSMNLEHKASRNYAWKARARHVAEGALRHAVSTLYATHEDTERLTVADPAGIGPQDYDDESELAVRFDNINVYGNVNFIDSRNAIWEARVEDENGKINVNTAPPQLISNLLGVTVLTSDAAYEDTRLFVEDTTPFWTDRDPRTIDGFVRIGREYVAYCDKDAESLKGCMRGLFFTPAEHNAGALLCDGRGWKIAEHRALANPGSFTLFDTPEAVRDVVMWTRFDLVTEILRFHRLYLDRLKEFGIDERDLEALGIDPDDLEPPEYEEPEPTESQRKAASEISAAGLDPDLIKKFFGNRGMEHIARRLERMPKEHLSAVKEYYKKIESVIKAREKERKEMLERYLPTAVANLRTAIDQMKMLISFETVPADKYSEIRDFITTTSWRPSDWTRRTQLRREIPHLSTRNDENWRTVNVDYTDWFNPGTTVRILSPSAVQYGVTESWGRGGLLLSADIQHNIQFLVEDTWVWAAYRHPVNVNTASKQVLKAVFTGLALQNNAYRNSSSARIAGGGHGDIVTPAEADSLVEYFRQRGAPLQSYEDLDLVLEGAVALGIISDRDRLAIMVNAINPNDPSLRCSTTGLIFKTHNIYSITATGIVSTPAGEEIASHRIRQVVEVSPPRTLKMVIDTQEDLSAGIVSGGNWDQPEDVAFAGREQNKLVTLPNDLTPAGSGTFRFPAVDHTPEVCNMRIKTFRMKDPPGAIYMRHYDDTLDGTDDSTFTVSSSEILPATGGQPGASPTGGMTHHDFQPGQFQMWFKPYGAGPRYFFDAGELEYTNRVSFYFDGSEFVLQVSDGTLDPEAQTLRGAPPSMIQEQTWYHVAASWRGVRYGDLAIFVDGQSVGRYENYTTLSTALDNVTYRIPVDDASFIPVGAVVIMDNEVVEVIGKSGNTIEVNHVPDPPGPGDPPLPPGTQPPEKRTAARGTTPSPHPAGTVVTIFGYSNPLNEELPIGGAYTAQEMYDHQPEASLVVLGNNTMLMDNETEIGIDDATEFPQQDAIIQIGQEKIHYDQVEESGNATRLTGCTRGIEGTTASTHNNRSGIHLISLLVDTTEEYKNSGYIQLDDEWISFSKANDAQYRGRFFILPISGGRGRCGTLAMAHTRGTKVIPVFKTSNRWCGAGDIVTVVDDSGGTPKRERMIINWTYMNDVAFTDWVQRRYYPPAGSSTGGAPAGSYRGRLLKWPSGELPSELPANASVGGRAVAGSTSAGAMSARIDELITALDPISLREYNFYLHVERGANIGQGEMSIPISASNTGAKGGLVTPGQGTQAPTNPSALINILSNMFRQGALVKIDDEVIGVYGVSQTATGVTLNQCKRGILGTSAATHPGGSRVYILPFPLMGKITGNITSDGIPIEVDARFVPQEGYFQVARPNNQGEIVPYLRAQNRWFRRHVDVNYNPCFRASFGSPQTGCMQGDIAVFLPVRYWDLYTPLVDSVQGVIFQTTETIKGAYWKRITWAERDVWGKNIRLLVRFDDSAAWSDEPTNQPGGLYQFDDPAEDNILNVRADKIEIRAFFTYPQGAYMTDIWKSTAILDSIELDYCRPPIVHINEVLED